MGAEFRNIGFIAACALLFVAFFVWEGGNLAPSGGTVGGAPVRVVIRNGAGFFDVLRELDREKLVRSPATFALYALRRGDAFRIKPGSYEFSGAMSGMEILARLVDGPNQEVTVVIPEGSTMYEIDKILSAEGVTERGSFARFAQAKSLEGKLFPDTYRFFVGSPVEEVTAKLAENFEAKAMPILGRDPGRLEERLVVASLLEREIPDFEERRIAAGVIEKRLALSMPLQVDASLCYAKERQAFDAGADGAKCSPLTSVDLKTDSPYNTYLYYGLPPTPIGSPGTSSIEAAMRPKASPYLYYLSDPATKRTIFAETFDEHYANKLKYLN